ncbi:putative DExH-box ATP-dependent RNA helicase DExH7; chloroplastic [Paratrimastix pyriformis]|uniref:DExH-box ATP-dependent RNA helicase DExH7 n=1 Tax=Paratrimastix pyriformis TaxID=342808 RepID=A0ABQ8UIL7_9EUKA|nr:putative DExH-box ATP-dependent RNA helicase DExH7; chloroplastic [Paratrimastix pyriformis]
MVSRGGGRDDGRFIKGDVSYLDSSLPIFPFAQQIVETVARDQVVIVTGLPSELLCISCHHQAIRGLGSPRRRIAATSLAVRVAHERHSPLGAEVGYQISMDRQCDPRTQIVYVTSGLLLQQLTMAPSHDAPPFTHILLDEVHERDIDEDFLMAILRDRLAAHPALRLVLMSATMETRPFARYFRLGARNQVAVLPQGVAASPGRERDREPTVLQVGGSCYPVRCHFLGQTCAFLNQPPPASPPPRAPAGPCPSPFPQPSPPRPQPEPWPGGDEERAPMGGGDDAGLANGEAVDLAAPPGTDGGPCPSPPDSSSPAASPSPQQRQPMHRESLSLRGVDGVPGLLYEPESLPSPRLREARLEGPLVGLLCDLVLRIHSQQAALGDPSEGALLVFLPGLGEIQAVHGALEEANRALASPAPLWIVPLHSTLASETQASVFQRRPGMRKVVLATNIAESSVTVPDVVAVVDSCLAREVHYDPETHLQSLRLQWISQAAATQARCATIPRCPLPPPPPPRGFAGFTAPSGGLWGTPQRMGRAGRVRPGVCYRLVPEGFFREEMPPQSAPEMCRCPLESLVLKVKRLGLGSPVEYLAKCIDPPLPAAIEAALDALTQAGGLDRTTGELTFGGRLFAGLPFDYRLSRLVILGAAFGRGEVCLRLACLASLRPLFQAPYDPEARRAAVLSQLRWDGGLQAVCLGSSSKPRPSPPGDSGGQRALGGSPTLAERQLLEGLPEGARRLAWEELFAGPARPDPAAFDHHFVPGGRPPAGSPSGPGSGQPGSESRYLGALEEEDALWFEEPLDTVRIQVMSHRSREPPRGDGRAVGGSMPDLCPPLDVARALWPCGTIRKVAVQSPYYYAVFGPPEGRPLAPGEPNPALGLALRMRQVDLSPALAAACPLRPAPGPTPPQPGGGWGHANGWDPPRAGGPTRGSGATTTISRTGPQSALALTFKLAGAQVGRGGGLTAQQGILAGTPVGVGPESIAAAALEADPLLMPYRFMVAAFLTGRGDIRELVARQCTLMPALPLVPTLLGLLFCQYAEARSEGPRYVGFLLNGTWALQPDGDLTPADLAAINRLRAHLSDYLLHGGSPRPRAPPCHGPLLPAKRPMPTPPGQAANEAAGRAAPFGSPEEAARALVGLLLHPAADAPGPCGPHAEPPPQRPLRARVGRPPEDYRHPWATKRQIRAEAPAAMGRGLPCSGPGPVGWRAMVLDARVLWVGPLADALFFRGRMGPYALALAERRLGRLRRLGPLRGRLGPPPGNPQGERYRAAADRARTDPDPLAPLWLHELPPPRAQPGGPPADGPDERAELVARLGAHYRLMATWGRAERPEGSSRAGCGDRGGWGRGPRRGDDGGGGVWCEICGQRVRARDRAALEGHFRSTQHIKKLRGVRARLHLPPGCLL